MLQSRKKTTTQLIHDRQIYFYYFGPLNRQVFAATATVHPPRPGAGRLWSFQALAHTRTQGEVVTVPRG